MDLRNQVKQVLRHCGHAIVSTIHDRLNGVETELNKLTAQTADIGESQAALLQSAVFVVEVLKQLQSELRQRDEEQKQHLERLSQQNVVLAEEQRKLVESCLLRLDILTAGQDSARLQGEELKQQVESVPGLVAGSEESQAALLQASIHLTERLNDTHAEFRQQVDRVLKQIASAGKTQSELVRSCITRVGSMAEAQESMLQELRERVDGVQQETAGAAQSLVAVHQELQIQADQTSRAAELLRNMRAVLEAGANSEAQSSLLQTGLQVLDSLKQDQQMLSQQGDAFRQQFQQLTEQHSHIIDSTRQTLQQVLGLQNYTQNVFDQELVRQVCVETSDYGVVNPETGLMEYLYSYLPTHKALDIGAHVGDVSERLLKTGYEVFAFEPYPPSYKKLVRRFDKQPKFHPHDFALGYTERDLPLHLAKDRSANNVYDDATIFNSLSTHSMPDDLPFVKTVLVSVKNLASLHRSGAVPADIGLVKIDTEGYDLEVIRGMKDFRYPVVMAEFWDREIPFGKSGLLYTVDSLVAEMKARGYRWHIIIYRIWGRNQRAFYCNHDRSVPESWGNILFFQQYNLFAKAQTWCSATLPRTFFKPAPAKA